MLADDDELLAVLADTFELSFPRGTRFAYAGDHGAGDGGGNPAAVGGKEPA
jgi:hypothetical protein